MPGPRVTLNVDLGELPDEPDELYAIADVVNVACGGHAGDDASMARALRLAREHGAVVAAHPSYPDRDGFGRTTVAMTPGALTESVRAQCAALARLAWEAGVRVAIVKPHGALYHDVTRDRALADAVVRGARRGLGEKEPTFVGAAGGELEACAEALGLPFDREGFADRGYRDGRLVPRGEPGALITDPEAAAEQASALATTGTIETLCVHSDTKGALVIARRVKDVLAGLGRGTFGP